MDFLLFCLCSFRAWSFAIAYFQIRSCSDKILTCHNYRGIAWAPACGIAMAELVVDGECKSVNLDPFDPARFTPALQAGTRGRKRRGQNVGEQW